MKAGDKLLALTRISLGLIFLWAFFDKVFGLGFATAKESAWVNGGSPTTGYLTYAVKGPFASMFQAMAGSTFVDWLFMIGLLGIGIGLTFDIARKLSCYSGALMLFLMWLAVLLPEHHPFLDDHLVYALILLFLAKKDTPWSLQKKWKKTALVKKFPFLK